MKATIGVETSDIVGSTKLSSEQLKSALQVLKKCHAQHQEDQHIIVEYYRGDAYQVMYPDPIWSLKGLILTRLTLLYALDFKVNITQSLAIGGISEKVSNLHNNMQTVFVNSGRQLDKLAKGDFAVNGEQFGSNFSLICLFTNRMMHGLSSKQAQVLYWYIAQQYPEHKKIAAKLSMTRQNVNTHLRRANADLIKQFLDAFENTFKS